MKQITRPLTVNPHGSSRCTLSFNLAPNASLGDRGGLEIRQAARTSIPQARCGDQLPGRGGAALKRAVQ